LNDQQRFKCSANVNNLLVYFSGEYERKNSTKHQSVSLASNENFYLMKKLCSLINQRSSSETIFIIKIYGANYFSGTSRWKRLIQLCQNIILPEV